MITNTKHGTPSSMTATSRDLAQNPHLVGFACLQNPQEHRFDVARGVQDRGIGCPHCHAAGKPASVKMLYNPELNMRSRSSVRGVGLERFSQLLACTDFPTLGAGDTPLVPLPRLARHYNVGAVFAKLEYINPASYSYKARCMPLSVARACQLGKRVVTAASSGNAGVELAACAAVAGIKCKILSTPDITDIWANSITAYGAELRIVPTAKDRWRYIKEMVIKEGWYSVTNCEDPPVGSNPYGVEGYETIAWEIDDALGEPPKFVISPVARGDGLAGMWSGFLRDKAAGIISRLPRMVAVEPIARLEKVMDGTSLTTDHFTGDRHCMASIGGDTVTYQAYAALRDSKGLAVTITDGQAHRAKRILGRLGRCVELSSAAALAGLGQLNRMGKLHREDSVVLILTSAGYKDLEVRPHLRRIVALGQ